MEVLFQIITQEIEILEIEKRINFRVKKQIEKNQKEFYLREQMKAIQRELGQQDERIAEADEYREKIDGLNIPDELEEKMLKEVERLEKMPPASAELSVIRTYLDWLTSLPWNVVTKDSVDIKEAEDVLNEDHYGLAKVKERILEFLESEIIGKIKDQYVLWYPGAEKTSLPDQ